MRLTDLRILSASIVLAGLMILTGSCVSSCSSRYDMMPSTDGCGYRLNRATGELIRFSPRGSYKEIAKTRVDKPDGN